MSNLNSKHSADNKVFGEAKANNVVHHEKRKVGRPKGPATTPAKLTRRQKAIRAVTDRHIKYKRLPLDILVENMHHFQDEARALTEKLGDVLRVHKEADTMDGEQIVKALELVAAIGDNRMKAGHFASQAAPYIHARLSAIHHSGAIATTPRDLPDDALDDAVMDDFRRLRSMDYVPPVIEARAELVSETVTAEEDE